MVQIAENDRINKCIFLSRLSWKHKMQRENRTENDTLLSECNKILFVLFLPGIDREVSKGLLFPQLKSFKSMDRWMDDT